MLKCITGNPFRILGVYANTPTKEIIASKSKLLAGARVNRQFPTQVDFVNLYGELSRNIESLEEAHANISVQEGKVSSCLFWYVCCGSADFIALNHLAAGEDEQAIEIWNRVRSVSSNSNLIVYFLSKEQYVDALVIAESHFVTNKSAILNMYGANPSLNVDLFRLIVDTLIAEGVSLKYERTQLKNPASKEYIESIITKPCVDSLYKAIEKAHAVKPSQGPNARLEAGRRLMREASIHLLDLRATLEVDSKSYMFIADKLSEEILLCAIHYYNESSDTDRSLKAVELSGYALSLAKSPIQIERCKKNHDTIHFEAVIDKAVLDADKEMVQKEKEAKRKAKIEKEKKEKEDLERKRKESEERERVQQQKIQELYDKINSCQSIDELAKLKYKYTRSLQRERLDDKFFSLCKSRSDYKKYITVLGQTAKHYKEAKEKSSLLHNIKIFSRNK